MAPSEHLRALRVIWGESCHGMWAELLCITMAETHVISNYADISQSTSIDEMFYTPDLKGRINGLTRDAFLERAPTYRHTVVTNRIVILSASFEAYFSNFLDAYIANRNKLFDPTSSQRTVQGNKLLGEVRKTRGLVERIRIFANLTGSKIKTIEPLLEYLGEVYTLRNVLAHRAGIVDQHASQSLVRLRIAPGNSVVLTPEVLVELAAPVIKIADFLDRKIVSEYDNTIGAHRPEFVEEQHRRKPPLTRPSRLRT